MARGALHPALDHTIERLSAAPMFLHSLSTAAPARAHVHGRLGVAARQKGVHSSKATIKSAPSFVDRHRRLGVKDVLAVPIRGEHHAFSESCGFKTRMPAGTPLISSTTWP